MNCNAAHPHRIWVVTLGNNTLLHSIHNSTLSGKLEMERRIACRCWRKMSVQITHENEGTNQLPETNLIKHTQRCTVTLSANELGSLVTCQSTNGVERGKEKDPRIHTRLNVLSHYTDGIILHYKARVCLYSVLHQCMLFIQEKDKNGFVYLFLSSWNIKTVFAQIILKHLKYFNMSYWCAYLFSTL